MSSYWREANLDDLRFAFALDELRSNLGAQMLCFRNGAGSLDAPYIATNLQLYVFDYYVGWYECLTTLAGEIIREDGRIQGDYYSDGRAAILIERARNRVADDRREWIGLVELGSASGNRFFPDWAAGGFTIALALATGAADYQHQVEEHFQELGVEVEEFEDIELLSDRLRTDPCVDDEVFELGGRLSAARPVLHSSTVYSYSSRGNA